MNLVSSDVVQSGLQQLREAGELDDDSHQLFTESERYGHSFQLGHKEGFEQGLAQGLEHQRNQLRRIVADVLALRGFTLTDAQRQRIAACESLATLERWYTAAMTAAANQSVDQLLS